MAECRMGEPPNPPDLAQAIAAMLTGRDEQTALLREIVEQGRAQQHEPHHQPLLLDIRSFWLLSRRCSTKPMSHWKQIAGSGPSSPSSHCTGTMMGIRQDLQPSSSGVPHALGGTIKWPCFSSALGSPGHNSRRLSWHIISLQGSFAGSSSSS